MTAEHTAQLGAALLTAGTALLVTAIVYRVANAHACEHGHDLPAPRSFGPLRIATIAAAAAAGAAAIWLPAQSPWMFLVSGLAFALTSVFGRRALSDLDRASRPAREVAARSRSAALTPRRASQYLPWSVRSLTYVIAAVGAALLLMRIGTPLAHRQLLVPLVFGFGASMFVLLYESWIQGVATGPVVQHDAERQRVMIRRIFTAELLLVVSMLVVAHAVLDLNWTTDGGLGAWICFAGGAIGIAGCALALASELIGRKYRVIA